MSRAALEQIPGAWIWAHYVGPVVYFLLPVFIATLCLTLLVGAANTATTRKRFSQAVTFLLPFSWLGGISGLIAGASQEAIVGALLTGMLTIVAALLSYFFAQDSLAAWRAHLPFAIILLCLSVTVGLALGRIHKSAWDAYDRSHAQWRIEHEKVDVPMMLLRERYDYCRQQLGRDRAHECDAMVVAPL